MRLKAVVLPAPFGPISPTSSLRPISKSNSDTAISPPKRIVALSSWRRADTVVQKLTRTGAFAKVKETLRPGEHQDNQQERINDHSSVSHPTQRFIRRQAGKMLNARDH